MVEKVRKRDGRTVKYYRQRIVNAIVKAMEETNQYDAEKAAEISRKIEKDMSSNECMSVEDIQDIVEKELMANSLPEVAKAYILYRDKRDKARNSTVNQIISDIISAKKNDITRENANMNADTPAGMMMKIASERSKEYTMDFLLSNSAKKAMKDNILHPHDLDYYLTGSLTCLQHPVDKILSNGFRAGHGESRGAKRIETASILSAISMESIQNEMHGGQAIPAFDFYLAPYVKLTYKEEISKIEKLLNVDLSVEKEEEVEEYAKKEVNRGFKQHAINMTVDRVHQAMEAFIHNMNTIHSRGGNQVVFSSVNFGTDTSAEGRCVIREFLNSTYEGIGNGATAIFPISIFKVKEGVNYNPGDPNYDLLQLSYKVSAKRFFPNFINLDATFNRNDKWDANDPLRYEKECATMGCRTRVYEDRFGESTSIARGNLSFSTINLPGLAIRAMKKYPNNQDARVKCFMELLEKAAEVTGEQLYDRYKFQCNALAKQFPMLMSGMWVGSENLKPEDKIAPVLKHGTLGIGFIGLAECLIALTGKHHGESYESQQLGVSIVTYLRDKANEFSDRYNLNYSVLATPAEGLSGKFTKRDKKLFGIIPGVTDKDYYTNSNHVPVYYKCSAAHKAAIEGPYHELTRGGHIFYVELDGDATHNVEAVEDVVKLMKKYNIGYCSINHNRNRCLNCSYEDATVGLEKCPKCGSTDIDTLQRITGYLVGTTDRWNSGKIAELHDRVTHGI